jgi:hypothetical protein
MVMVDGLYLPSAISNTAKLGFNSSSNYKYTAQVPKSEMLGSEGSHKYTQLPASGPPQSPENNPRKTGTPFLAD